jgi:enoyl-CoA hydratase
MTSYATSQTAASANGFEPMAEATSDRPEQRPAVSVQIIETTAELQLHNGPLNLVDETLLHSLNKALTQAEEQPGVRALILHGGNGRAFCAGSDMRTFTGLGDSAAERKILFEEWVLRRLAALPFPTIAAVDGPALGGGLELALTCDLRVVHAGVSLGLTESRIGGLAGNGALRLTRLIGPTRAKEMLFTGETISADKALEWGLVNRVAAKSALHEARELAAVISGRRPLSNRFAKRLVASALDFPLDAGLAQATAFQQRIFNSADLTAGVASFFDKRSAEFNGT